MAVILLTALGVFVCSGISCERAPAGLQGYWGAPTATLYITIAYRPLVVLDCAPTERERTERVWLCGARP